MSAAFAAAVSASGLAALPQIDDRCEIHLFDFGYRLGFSRTAQATVVLQAIEISDALTVLSLLLPRAGAAVIHAVAVNPPRLANVISMAIPSMDTSSRASNNRS